MKLIEKRCMRIEETSDKIQDQLETYLNRLKTDMEKVQGKN